MLIYSVALGFVCARAPEGVGSGRAAVLGENATATTALSYSHLPVHRGRGRLAPSSCHPAARASASSASQPPPAIHAPAPMEPLKLYRVEKENFTGKPANSRHRPNSTRQLPNQSMLGKHNVSRKVKILTSTAQNGEPPREIPTPKSRPQLLNTNHASLQGTGR